MNIVIFGTGWYADEILMSQKILDKYGWKISGFLDNNEKKWGEKYGNSLIYPPSEIENLQYDVILIALTEQYYEDVYVQLTKELHVSPDKIHEYTWLLKQEFIKKYRNTKDPEIKATLSYWQNNSISPFNQYINIKNLHTLNEVFYDTEDDPYIAFITDSGENVRLYYPRDFKFFKKNGKLYVQDVLIEQSPNSPHAYFYGSHKVMNGDVIIDCGACEGNFSLRFADISSKIYIFESDERWIHPLKKTFAKFADKTEIINAYVSDKSDNKKVCLDNVINSSVDFIKMDIEGAEEEALDGAKKLMTEYLPKCSICGYHKTCAADRIRKVLSSYGYKTSFSHGFMTFIWGEDEWLNLDFRKGVVYGDK